MRRLVTSMLVLTLRLTGILFATGLVFFLATLVSPWPGAMVVRAAFNLDGMRRTQMLAPHVPAGISSLLDVRYDDTDPNALLDVYFPAGATALPTIVWVHGGAWVSGGRWQMAQFASILAADGYAVVAVGYSLAPEATYPTPLLQVSRALGFLERTGAQLHVDPTRLILAGDSAGAQIAAQLANAITSPDYAAAIGVVPPVDPSNLRGTVLFSGAYDLGLVKLDGVIGFFLRSVLWAYTGSRDFATDSRFAPASVVHFLSPRFPPTFISAGDADPLLAHSLAFAEALRALGVEVHGVFFDSGGTAGHNYQFDLDAESGRAALARLHTFLAQMAVPQPREELPAKQNSTRWQSSSPVSRGAQTEAARRPPVALAGR